MGCMEGAGESFNAVDMGVRFQILKDMLVKATMFGQHTVSRRYIGVQPVTPYSFSLKKIKYPGKDRVGVLCPVNLYCLISFYCALYINRSTKFPFTIKAIGDFIMFYHVTIQSYG